jgi:hypothetical protein
MSDLKRWLAQLTKIGEVHYLDMYRRIYDDLLESLHARARMGQCWAVISPRLEAAGTGHTMLNKDHVRQAMVTLLQAEGVNAKLQKYDILVRWSPRPDYERDN